MKKITEKVKTEGFTKVVDWESILIFGWQPTLNLIKGKNKSITKKS